MTNYEVKCFARTRVMAYPWIKMGNSSKMTTNGFRRAQADQAVQDDLVGLDVMTTPDGFYKQLLEDAIETLGSDSTQRGALIGEWKVASRLGSDLLAVGLQDRLIGFFGSRPGRQHRSAMSCFELDRLMEARPSTLIVASDAEKEQYLRSVAGFIQGAPKVILAGYGHYDFRDPRYRDVVSALEERSLANGYPNSRIHLYQCLVNAAKLDLDGLVVEFGMFRGGTTMFLSQVIERLGRNWPVIGFDTFSGFPPRQSYLDMYDHDDLSLVSLTGVRSYLQGRNVRVVAGDIGKTAPMLRGQPIVLAFIDTDNFTPATAAIEAIQDNVVPGGALVFDHLTGIDRFRYTLGERLAAERLFDDRRYFNLYGTGVFVRQGGVLWESS